MYVHQVPRNCSKDNMVKMIALGLMLIAIKKNIEEFNKNNSLLVLGIVAFLIAAAYLYKNRFSIQIICFNFFGKPPSQMKKLKWRSNSSQTAKSRAH